MPFNERQRADKHTCLSALLRLIWSREPASGAARNHAFWVNNHNEMRQLSVSNMHGNVFAYSIPSGGRFPRRPRLDVGQESGIFVSLRPASVRWRGFDPRQLGGKSDQQLVTGTAEPSCRLASWRCDEIWCLIKAVRGPCFNLKVFQTANDGEQPEHPRPRRWQRTHPSLA